MRAIAVCDSIVGMSRIGLFSALAKLELKSGHEIDHVQEKNFSHTLELSSFFIFVHMHLSMYEYVIL